MKTKLIFAWYDIWVGFFWDSKKKWLYFFPIPMFGIIFKCDWLTWTSVHKHLPPDETLIECKFKDGSTNDNVMYWNRNEGFDAQAKPFGLMVTHWRHIKI